MLCPIGKELSDRYGGILHMNKEHTPYGNHYFACSQCQGYEGLAHTEKKQFEEWITKIFIDYYNCKI